MKKGERYYSLLNRLRALGICNYVWLDIGLMEGNFDMTKRW